MLSDNHESNRPWLVIASEITQEHNSQRLLSLVEELTRALACQGSQETSGKTLSIQGSGRALPGNPSGQQFLQGSSKKSSTTELGNP